MTTGVFNEAPEVTSPASSEIVRRGVLGSCCRMSWKSGKTEAWTTDGKPIDNEESSCRGVWLEDVVIEFNLFLVLSKKEFGEVSGWDLSWCRFFFTFLRLPSIVPSSSVFDTEVDCSRTWNLEEFEWGKAEGDGSAVISNWEPAESGVTARTVGSGESVYTWPCRTSLLLLSALRSALIVPFNGLLWTGRSGSCRCIMCSSTSILAAIATKINPQAVHVWITVDILERRCLSNFPTSRCWCKVIDMGRPLIFRLCAFVWSRLYLVAQGCGLILSTNSVCYRVQACMKRCKKDRDIHLETRQNTHVEGQTVLLTDQVPSLLSNMWILQDECLQVQQLALLSVSAKS